MLRLDGGVLSERGQDGERFMCRYRGLSSTKRDGVGEECRPENPKSGLIRFLKTFVTLHTDQKVLMAGILNNRGLYL